MHPRQHPHPHPHQAHHQQPLQRQQLETLLLSQQLHCQRPTHLLLQLELQLSLLRMQPLQPVFAPAGAPVPAPPCWPGW